jgi:hypothetical protein
LKWCPVYSILKVLIWQIEQKFSNYLFLCCEILTKFVMTSVGFVVSFIPLYLNCSTFQTIIYGIPHSLLIALRFYFMYSINIWQLFYFYLICYYLKLKLRKINRELILKIKPKRSINDRNILHIIKYLTSLYSEVEKYNSKYLFCIWLLFKTIINSFLCLRIFAEMNLIIRFIFIYDAIVFICTLLLATNKASSVNLEVNKSSWILIWLARRGINSINVTEF